MAIEFSMWDYIKVWVKQPKVLFYEIKSIYIKKKYDFIHKQRMKQFEEIMAVAKRCKRYLTFGDNWQTTTATIENPLYVVSNVISKHCTNVVLLCIRGIDVDLSYEEQIYVTITLARPGLIIGKAGKTIPAITDELTSIFGKKTNINIKEWKMEHIINPDDFGIL